MQLIILSANKSPFSEVPISKLDINGNSLLDLQVVVAHECNISNINLVVGFKYEEIENSYVNKHVNHHWETTESCSSLNKVLSNNAADDDMLLVYGDTIFTPKILQQVMRSKHDFTICSITENGEAFREYCVIENGELIRIDKNNKESFSVFTGVFLIKKKKIPLMRELVQNHLSLGELINELINKGEEICTHIIDNGWHEINSQQAFGAVKQNNDFLCEIIAVHTDWSKRALRYDQLDWVNRDVLTKGILDATERCHTTCALDVGTGTGKIMKAIRSKYPACECWGIDSSETMLDHIEDKENYIIKVTNAEDLSELPDQHYDLVTARMVFHHIENPQKAASEIRRVLKPGGLFIICEGNPPSIRAIDWYTRMFSFKEERSTITEIDLINLLVLTGLSDITTKTIIMKDCSLTNWLANSGLPSENIETITKMHFEAPEHIKEDYNMTFRDNDCFMDWKFSIVYGYAFS
ncbi:putative methyltransferase YcgJ [bacterium BMS3Abin15]|nr:putative methyltransferase YcgJ [bacterium BMS3Abin15]